MTTTDIAPACPTCGEPMGIYEWGNGPDQYAYRWWCEACVVVLTDPTPGETVVLDYCCDRADRELAS